VREDRFTSFLGQGLSRDRAVLVDEPTEHVVALDLGPGRSVGGGSTGGHAEVEAAMRAFLLGRWGVRGMKVRCSPW
jgi:hypothetical protein